MQVILSYYNPFHHNKAVISPGRIFIDIPEAISMADRVMVLSNRPATIKSIYDIKLTCQDGEASPIKCREAPEFRHYFNQIWRELDVYVQ